MMAKADESGKTAELIVRAQGGDEEAKGLIYERFTDMAFAYAYSITGNRELAEDARHDAFIEAYCDLKSIREPAAFDRWFKTIIRRRSVRLTRLGRVLTIPIENAPDVAADTPSPAKQAEAKEIAERVEQALTRLPATEAAAVRLFHIDGLSLIQTSQALDVSVASVKDRLRKARGRLRHRLVDMVKDNVRSGMGDRERRALRREATEEAVSAFDREIRHLSAMTPEKTAIRLVQLLCGKGTMLRFLGRLDEALSSLEEGLSHPTIRSDPLLAARLRTEKSLTLIRHGEYGDARHELQLARVQVKRSGNGDRQLAAILNALGMCAWCESSLTKARRYYEESLALSRPNKWRVLRADAEVNLALIEWKAGEYEKALALMRGALRQWKSLDAADEQARTLMNIGIMEENMGRLASALKHYRQALETARQINQLLVQSAVQTNIGSVLLRQRKWAEALVCNSDSLDLAKKANDRRSQAIALENLALTYLGLGQSGNYEESLRNGRRIAKAIGDEERLFSLELVEIERRLEEQDLGGLAETIAEALDLLRRRGFRSELPRLLRLQARCEIQSGDLEAARKTLRQGIKECRKQKVRLEEKSILALGRKIGWKP